VTTQYSLPLQHSPAVRVQTREIPDVGDLISMLPTPADALGWVRSGEGLVAWGSVAVIETGGPNRFGHADAAWRGLVDRLDVHDEVGLPGTGPVAFVSFAFADDPGRSLLVVPQMLIGRRDGRSWLTEIDVQGSSATEPPLRDMTPISAPTTLRWTDGAMPPGPWRSGVTEAVRRMRAGELEKVVLARDLVAECATPLDPRYLMGTLAARHPSCWTFAVDGLVGATPELLLRRRGDVVDSRVLAGTIWPGTDSGMLDSSKHRQEHRLAVDSLLHTLGPWCASLHTTGPTPLPLATVTHLSTDVHGRLANPGRASLLELAAAVHPTAAVGGSPRPAALATISELELAAGMDRGRYAGPVGWIDAHGDGELGIALRCAQLSGTSARLFAGCGLVADSDPDTELAEATAKLRAVRDALDISPEAP
jgi:menaquinone-specific isochorismate synthase